MNKVLIIIKREYLTRVKKKMFLVTTFLIPILITGLIAMISYFAAKSSGKETIVIDDQSAYFQHKFDTTETSSTLVYAQPNQGESDADFLNRKEADVVVRIFPFRDNKLDSVVMYSDEGVSITLKSYIQGQINSLYSTKLLQDAGVNISQIDSINAAEVPLRSYSLKDNKETNAEAAMICGIGIGILMYMVLLLYGSSVMRGVMEEKTSRIAEVIISSVKPFQLMLGKILGIGLVCLTQMGLWLVLVGSLRFILPLFIPELHTGIGTNPMMQDPAMQKQMAEAASEGGSQLLASLSQLPWGTIITCFIIYFFGGYFTYAALFAAIGSLVNEDPQEAQQLALPVTMPIIFSYVIAMQTIKDPNSALSIFGSMFPLTSPTVMMARIPYGVPAYQIILSIVFLILGFLLFTWLSAKIYRIGILMYGKKLSWKEVIKWIRYS